MNESKKLYRVEKGNMIAGVCGGIAEYFNWDPNLVRIITVILFFAGTLGFWPYLICAIILPKKSDAYPGF